MTFFDDQKIRNPKNKKYIQASSQFIGANIGHGKLVLGQTWVGANLAGANLGLSKFGSGQTWVRANLDLGKFGFGQTWVRANMAGQIWSGQIWFGQIWGVIRSISKAL